MESLYHFKAQKVNQIKDDILNILDLVQNTRKELEKEEYGPMGFLELKSHYDEVEDTSKKIQMIDLNKVPLDELDRFYTCTNELFQVLQSIHKPYSRNENLISETARENKLSKFLSNKDNYIYYSSLFIAAFSDFESREASEAKELIKSLSAAAISFNKSKDDTIPQIG